MPRLAGGGALAADGAERSIELDVGAGAEPASGLVRRARPRPRDRRAGRERAALLAGRLDGDDRGRRRHGSRSSIAGPGLEPGEEEAVFERFSRGSAGRRGPGGTGLGLPIARELTRQWGGEVVLANREGGGTRASIRLPSNPDDAEER